VFSPQNIRYAPVIGIEPMRNRFDTFIKKCKRVFFKDYPKRNKHNRPETRKFSSFWSIVFIPFWISSSVTPHPVWFDSLKALLHFLIKVSNRFRIGSIPITGAYLIHIFHQTVISISVL
jgi:hypothetical protein